MHAQGEIRWRPCEGTGGLQARLGRWHADLYEVANGWVSHVEETGAWLNGRPLPGDDWPAATFEQAREDAEHSLLCMTALGNSLGTPCERRPSAPPPSRSRRGGHCE